MKMEEVQKKLKEILVDRLNAEEDQIKPEASFVEDLGADSLDIVELIMGIEEEFDIEIPDEAGNRRLKTLQVCSAARGADLMF